MARLLRNILVTIGIALMGVLTGIYTDTIIMAFVVVALVTFAFDVIWTDKFWYKVNIGMTFVLTLTLHQLLYFS